MAVPKDRKYAKSHEWVRIEGDVAYIGISDYAQEELGDVVFVEMPEVDEKVKKGAEIATVESVKASSPIYSPVSGKIAAVNAVLTDTPEQLNRTPWEAHLFTVTGFDPSELSDLMDASAYEKYVAEEKKNH